MSPVAAPSSARENRFTIHVEMCTQEFEGRDSPPCLVTCKREAGSSLCFLKSMISSFVFEVSMEPILSISGLHQSHSHGVIAGFNDDNCAVGWFAVVGVGRVEERTQDAALRSTSAECDRRGVMGAQPDIV